MTIQAALDRIDMIRPNNLNRHFKIAALSELDGLIMREIISRHEEVADDRDLSGWHEYTEESEPETELIAPFPYDEIYTYWLSCKVDLQNLETERYNNDRTLFNNAYDALGDYWTRTHMPKQPNRQLWI